MLKISTRNEWLNTMLEAISCAEVVIFYPNRIARVSTPLFVVERAEIDSLEVELAKKVGHPIGKYNAYEILYSDGTSFSVYCADDRIVIGVGITKEHWKSR